MSKLTHKTQQHFSSPRQHLSSSWHPMKTPLPMLLQKAQYRIETLFNNISILIGVEPLEPTAKPAVMVIMTGAFSLSTRIFFLKRLKKRDLLGSLWNKSGFLSTPTSLDCYMGNLEGRTGSHSSSVWRWRSSRCSWKKKGILLAFVMLPEAAAEEWFEFIYYTILYKEYYWNLEELVLSFFL